MRLRANRRCVDRRVGDQPRRCRMGCRHGEAWWRPRSLLLHVMGLLEPLGSGDPSRASRTGEIQETFGHVVPAPPRGHPVLPVPAAGQGAVALPVLAVGDGGCRPHRRQEPWPGAIPSSCSAAPVHRWPSTPTRRSPSFSRHQPLAHWPGVGLDATGQLPTNRRRLCGCHGRQPVRGKPKLHGHEDLSLEFSLRRSRDRRR